MIINVPTTIWFVIYVSCISSLCHTCDLPSKEIPTSLCWSSKVNWSFNCIFFNCTIVVECFIRLNCVCDCISVWCVENSFRTCHSLSFSVINCFNFDIANSVSSVSSNNWRSCCSCFAKANIFKCLCCINYITIMFTCCSI